MIDNKSIDDVVGPALGIAGTISVATGIMWAYRAYRATPDLFLEQPERYVVHGAPIAIGLMLIYHAFRYANRNTTEPIASSNGPPSNHDTSAE